MRLIAFRISSRRLSARLRTAPRMLGSVQRRLAILRRAQTEQFRRALPLLCVLNPRAHVPPTSARRHRLADRSSVRRAARARSAYSAHEAHARDTLPRTRRRSVRVIDPLLEPEVDHVLNAATRPAFLRRSRRRAREGTPPSARPSGSTRTCLE